MLADHLSIMLAPEPQWDPDRRHHFPLPGFPTMEPAIEWAKAYPDQEALGEALIDWLRTGTGDQQYAVMGILRGIGFECNGEYRGVHFQWNVVYPDGRRRAYSPRHQPEAIRTDRL